MNDRPKTGGHSTTIRKPPQIAASPELSAKWDELTEGREFSAKDAPTLALLCSWHAVMDRCIEDITVGDGVQVAYSNAMDDIKELPQIGTMKKASAEIRALSKQLGIEEADGTPKKGKVTPIALVAGRRADRKSGAARQA